MLKNRKSDANKTCAKNAQVVGKAEKNKKNFRSAADVVQHTNIFVGGEKKQNYFTGAVKSINTSEDDEELKQNDYLTIEQVKEKGLTDYQVRQAVKSGKLSIKEVDTVQGGKKKKLYKFNEIITIREQQQQHELLKIQNKAEKVLDEEGAMVVANSFKKVLEDSDPFEVLKMTTALNQLSMEKMFDLLNTKDRTISILDEKVSSLEVEVGKSKEYYSIKKVAIINSKREKDYKWSLLKRESVVLGKEIKTERDNNYGNVNSYHIDVWKKVYPNDNY